MGDGLSMDVSKFRMAFIEAFGDRKIADYAKSKGVSQQLARRRFDLGTPIEECFAPAHESLYKKAVAVGMNPSLAYYRTRVLGMTEEEALSAPVRRGKRTPEETREYLRIRRRVKMGLTEEQAKLPREELVRLGLLKPRGYSKKQYKIGDETLAEFCRRLGLKYNSVFVYYKRNGEERTKEHYDRR